MDGLGKNSAEELTLKDFGFSDPSGGNEIGAGPPVIDSKTVIEDLKKNQKETHNAVYLGLGRWEARVPVSNLDESLDIHQTGHVRVQFESFEGMDDSVVNKIKELQAFKATEAIISVQSRMMLQVDKMLNYYQQEFDKKINGRDGIHEGVVKKINEVRKGFVHELSEMSKKIECLVLGDITENDKEDIQKILKTINNLIKSNEANFYDAMYLKFAELMGEYFGDNSDFKSIKPPKKKYLKKVHPNKDLTIKLFGTDDCFLQKPTQYTAHQKKAAVTDHVGHESCLKLPAGFQVIDNRDTSKRAKTSNLDYLSIKDRIKRIDAIKHKIKLMENELIGASLGDTPLFYNLLTSINNRFLDFFDHTVNGNKQWEVARDTLDAFDELNKNLLDNGGSPRYFLINIPINGFGRSLSDEKDPLTIRLRKSAELGLLKILSQNRSADKVVVEEIKALLKTSYKNIDSPLYYTALLNEFINKVTDPNLAFGAVDSNSNKLCIILAKSMQADLHLDKKHGWLIQTLAAALEGHSLHGCKSANDRETHFENSVDLLINWMNGDYEKHGYEKSKQDVELVRKINNLSTVDPSSADGTLANTVTSEDLTDLLNKIQASVGVHTSTKNESNADQSPKARQMEGDWKAEIQARFNTNYCVPGNKNDFTSSPSGSEKSKPNKNNREQVMANVIGYKKSRSKTMYSLWIGSAMIFAVGVFFQPAGVAMAAGATALGLPTAIASSTILSTLSFASVVAAAPAIKFFNNKVLEMKAKKFAKKARLSYGKIKSIMVGTTVNDAVDSSNPDVSPRAKAGAKTLVQGVRSLVATSKKKSASVDAKKVSELDEPLLGPKPSKGSSKNKDFKS